MKQGKQGYSSCFLLVASKTCLRQLQFVNANDCCCLPFGVDGTAEWCQALALLTNTHIYVLYLVCCILWVLLLEFYSSLYFFIGLVHTNVFICIAKACSNQWTVTSLSHSPLINFECYLFVCLFAYLFIYLLQ